MSNITQCIIIKYINILVKLIIVKYKYQSSLQVYINSVSSVYRTSSISNIFNQSSISVKNTKYICSTLGVYIKHIMCIKRIKFV